jgi:hypothetical protein
MRQMILPLVLLGAALSAGCASMNADECRTANWEVVGYEDGSLGAPSSRVGNHRKSCAEHGVSPDLQAYTTGYDKGVRTYCVPDTAFALGKAGRNLPAVCPADLYKPFAAAFEEGRTVYLDIKKVNEQIAVLDKDIKKLNKQMEFLTSAREEVGADGQPPSRQEIDSADELIRRLEMDVQELQLQREQHTSELQTLRAATRRGGESATSARR